MRVCSLNGGEVDGLGSVQTFVDLSRDGVRRKSGSEFDGELMSW